MSLPEEKMAELRRILQEAASSRWIGRRPLQRLLGKLNWFAQVATTARTFLRQLIDVSIDMERRSANNCGGG
jgi:hypothetical protein